MESRKRLFKAGPRDNATLTDRVQRHKNHRQATRENKFAASRQIPVDLSPSSPAPARNAIKVSQIADKNEKLKAFRLERNTRKFQEIQEQRSPFVLAVPVGRWVEKKERTRSTRMDMNNTPVRAALMNERVLKKSTVKNLAAKSTAKKENVMLFNGKSKENVLAKSKKKILGELNAAVFNEEPKDEADFVPLELNTTYEREENDEKETPAPAVKESHRLRRSKSFAGIVESEVVTVKRKANTPPGKTTMKTKTPVKVKRRMTVVIKKPVVAKKPAAPAVVLKKEVSIKRQAIRKTQPIKTSKSAVELISQPTQDVQKVAQPKPAAKKKEPQRSQTYLLYHSSLNTQIKFLSMELNSITSNKDSFFDLLTEDQQISVNELIQQGNLLITDKLGKFGELLNKFEDDLSRPSDPKRVTENDVENYWFLIYEEIEKLKVDLSKMQTMKNDALKVLASSKKRRTRRTYIPEGGTPKRSIRIADKVDTPKHNASCYGCVTMSASKINTPKSANKRRTTGKKSVLFENVETPKRADSNRRATKRHKPTPKRNLMRMNAVDGDMDDEEGLDF